MGRDSETQLQLTENFNCFARTSKGLRDKRTQNYKQSYQQFSTPAGETAALIHYTRQLRSRIFISTSSFMINDKTSTTVSSDMNLRFGCMTELTYP